jgi:glycoside/pentoside/hexuronide:cation symporter, GPH family
MSAEVLAIPGGGLAPRLSTAACAGWGVGSLGMSLMFSATGVLMLRFLVDYVGIAAAVAGLLISLAKIYDAVTDPLIGVLSDRTHSRWGRRRPYLLWGGLLSALTFVAIFQLGALAGTEWKVGAAVVVLLLNATGYALFNVPYLAMPAEMTPDYHERTRLMSFRVAGVAAGQLFASSVGPLLIVWFGGGVQGHAATSWFLGAIIAISALICFQGTRGAPLVAFRPTEFSFRAQLRAALSNRPFLLLLGVKLTYLFGLSVYFAVLTFLFTYVMKISYSYLSLYFLLQGSGMLLSQPLWVRLTRRLGKKHAYYAASALYCLPLASWLLAAPGEPGWAVVLRGAFAGVAGGGLLLIGQSMLPDTMEHDFRLTGERREGLLSGIYTTVEKLSFSIGPALLGLVLGAAGYVSSATAAAAQPAAALRAIYICASLLPMASTLVGCLLLRAYTLEARDFGQASRR